MSDRKLLITNIESSSIVTPIAPAVQNYGSIQETNAETNVTDEMSENRTTLNFLQKVGYSLGHVFNDLCAGIWFR